LEVKIQQLCHHLILISLVARENEEEDQGDENQKHAVCVQDAFKWNVIGCLVANMFMDRSVNFVAKVRTQEEKYLGQV
jgi:hypothetical protein